jgi:hypothetical protein
MPARHWTRSRPIFEMVEAAFAEASFIGLNQLRIARAQVGVCQSGGLVQVTTLGERH